MSHINRQFKLQILKDTSGGASGYITNGQLIKGKPGMIKTDNTEGEWF